MRGWGLSLRSVAACSSGVFAVAAVIVPGIVAPHAVASPGAPASASMPGSLSAVVTGTAGRLGIRGPAARAAGGLARPDDGTVSRETEGLTRAALAVSGVAPAYGCNDKRVIEMRRSRLP